jgi:hypothetical protein
MVDTVSLAAFATQMSTQNSSSQIATDVLQKAQNLQKQQGNDVLQLIQNSVTTPNVSSNSIDVHV